LGKSPGQPNGVNTLTYQTDCALPDELTEQIADQGLDVLPDLIRTIINATMNLSGLINQ
jgi:hypothetical protein